MFTRLFGKGDRKGLSPISHMDAARREIEQKKSLARPSQNGLYPEEILMLSYAPKMRQGQKEYQAFWCARYAVDDPGALITSLCRRGFLRETTRREALDMFTAAALRDILRDAGLPTDGKKADLAARASELLSERNLRRYVPAGGYTLTNLGREEVEANPYVLYIHRRKYTEPDIWRMSGLVHDYPRKSWRDLIWMDFHGRRMRDCREQIKLGNWGPYRALRFEQYVFAMEEKNYELAFQLLVEAVHVAVRIEAVNRYLALRKTDATSAETYADAVDVCVVQSQIARDFAELQDVLNLDDMMLCQKIRQEAEKHKKPLCAMGSREMAIWILHLVRGQMNDAKHVLEHEEKQLKKM